MMKPTLLTRFKLLLYDLGLRRRKQLCAKHLDHIAMKVGTSHYLAGEDTCEECKKRSNK